MRVVTQTKIEFITVALKFLGVHLLNDDEVKKRSMRSEIRGRTNVGHHVARGQLTKFRSGASRAGH
jgi:hypothetical protein